MTVLEIDGMSIQASSGKSLVNDVSFEIGSGEIVGIVGESGSGKTMVVKSILGLLPPGVRRTGGGVTFMGRDVGAMSPKDIRTMRGNRVGMIFQEPMTSLNPSMTVGRQMEEGLKLHRDISPGERKRLVLDMLSRVGIRDPEGAVKSFPHQFSGGMRQRIMIASVMLLEPTLLIADEPTTALDAIIQKEVLDLLVGLAAERQTAVLLISHDLPMIGRYTSRMIVMADGEIKEAGQTASLMANPKHPYTRLLLGSIPRRRAARVLPVSEPAVRIEGLAVDYRSSSGFSWKPTSRRVVENFDLSIGPGEVVAVVGESGSGKTTIGRALAGLIKPAGGRILFDGASIADGGASYRNYRQNCQMVFQDPYSSLDPRMTVEQLVAEALRRSPILAGERKSKVREAMDDVGLAADLLTRFPHQLSGGQRQRVAIARAVVRRPRLVIADEPASALDVTVRAQVLDLLRKLQERDAFSCLFISHDLSVVQEIADRVVVMRHGKIVETGTRDQIFDDPQHDYTRKLLAASRHLGA